MMTSATVYLHPNSGSECLRYKASPLRALPTSIIACQAARGHFFAHCPLPLFKLFDAPCCGLWADFYSIPRILSRSLYKIPYFAAPLPAALLFLTPYYLPRYYAVLRLLSGAGLLCEIHLLCCFLLFPC